jgi:hypothetical protein
VSGTNSGSSYAQPIVVTIGIVTDRQLVGISMAKPGPDRLCCRSHMGRFVIIISGGTRVACFFKTARFSEDGELHQAVCGMTGTYGTLMMCSRSSGLVSGAARYPERRANDSHTPPPISATPDSRRSHRAGARFRNNLRLAPAAIAQPASVTAAIATEMMHITAS